jgi:nucleotide-binding universal stress UspA family protein
MFERILVPLDGSQRAERAIPVAVHVAQATGASLVLLRVLSATVELVPFVAAALEPSMLSADQAAAEGYMAGVAATISEVSVTTAVRTGRVAAVIAAYARECAADTIILCSHGEAGLAQRVLGSVAERLVHSAPVPMLLLREQGPLPVEYLSKEESSVRVLAPLDGLPGAEDALLPAGILAGALAAPGQGAIDLVLVVPPPADDAARANAEQYLRTLADQLGREALERLDVAVTWSVAVGDNLAEAVLALASADDQSTPDRQGIQGAQASRYHLVALATPPASRTHHWPLGEAVERVLHATKLPLLLVHPTEGAQP